MLAHVLSQVSLGIIFVPCQETLNVKTEGDYLSVTGSAWCLSVDCRVKQT